MRQRCNNPQHPKYPAYGARGISVAPAWDDFPAFLADVGDRPPSTSLDRIDNDGPYAPGNVQWSTAAAQRLNQHRSKWAARAARDEAEYIARCEAGAVSDGGPDGWE